MTPYLYRFTCGTWLIFPIPLHIWDMTHFLCALARGTWPLFYVHARVGHDSFTYGTWFHSCVTSQVYIFKVMWPHRRRRGKRALASSARNIYTSSGVWRSHGTRVNESWSWHIYEWIMEHIWMSHGTYMNESWHTYQRASTCFVCTQYLHELWRMKGDMAHV